MENELGIKKGSLEGFVKYISAYTSPEVVNAPMPPKYPLGALILPKPKTE